MGLCIEIHRELEPDLLESAYLCASVVEMRLCVFPPAEWLHPPLRPLKIPGCIWRAQP